MKQESKTRETYAQHGIILQAVGASQYRGDSPFSPPGKGEGKFYVHRTSGLFDDKRAGISGNLQKFFELKSQLNEKRFRGTVAKELSEDRGIPIGAMRAFRVGFDGRKYTIPLDVTGKCYDLRRYELGGSEMSTTGSKTSLAGVVDKNSDTVFLCEGSFDGMAFWQMLQDAGEQATVLSVPGAGTFPKHAVDLFRNKRVRVLYDNDDPGKQGTTRVRKHLEGIASEILYVNWSEDLPDGFDVRDFYKSGKLLVDLLKLVTIECPGGEDPTAAPPIEQELAKLTGAGMQPAEVVKSYRKFLYLPNTEVLDVMFGAVFANRLDGDPIWLLVVAPPGGSKTELIMTLSDGPLIRTISTLTPRTLVSGGFQQNGSGDPSLLPQLNGRVLAIKDFTTILSMPQQNRDEIFGTLREVYDGRFEKSWGTGVSRRYDVKFGIIAGVTPFIEKFSASSSVLGERFIKYRIPRTTRLQSDNALIDAALANLNRETHLRKELQQTATTVLNRPVGKESAPEISYAIRIKIRKIAQWVAALRGVVSRDRFTRQVEFKPTAEVGTRLAKQFAKLSQGIAIYQFKDEVDDGIYQTILGIARGTVPDRLDEVIRHLYMSESEEEGSQGFTPDELAKRSSLDTPTIKMVLMDLELLKTVRSEKQKKKKMIYRLSRAMNSLMNDLDLYKREGEWRYARSQAKAEAKNGSSEGRRKPKRKPKRKLKTPRRARA